MHNNNNRFDNKLQFQLFYCCQRFNTLFHRSFRNNSMSTNDRLVTFAYKKKKNPSTITEKSKIIDVLPSSSKSNLDKDIEFLKAFDLNVEYGPCVGITRLERWERANKHHLNPDPTVKQLVVDHQGDEIYTQCLWNDYKNSL